MFLLPAAQAVPELFCYSMNITYRVGGRFIIAACYRPWSMPTKMSLHRSNP